MATGVVDRAEWAKVVQEILDIEAEPLEPGSKLRTHGAKTRFAARVGVAVRTLDSWVRMENDVKESSVRQVAEGYGVNPMHLLVRVGYYAMDEMLPRLTDEQVDEEQRAVLDRDDLDDEQKAYILQELDAMRSTDEHILEEQRHRDRQRRSERIEVLIDRFRRVG